jgi:hypothetical protein
MSLNKYSAGLLTLLGTLVYAFQVSTADNILAVDEVWQLVGLAAGSAVAIFVPLTKGTWAAALKVVGNTVVAIAGAVIGAIAAGEWTTATWTALVFVAVNALLTQLGVSIRMDDVKKELAASAIPVAVTTAADAPAVQAAIAQGAAVNVRSSDPFGQPLEMIEGDSIGVSHPESGNMGG